MATKKMTQLIVLFLLIGSLDLLAEGPGGSGGGKGILCKTSEYDSTLYLADTFDYFHDLDSSKKSSRKVLPNINKLEDVLQGVVAYLQTTKPEPKFDHPFRPNVKVSFGWLVEYTYANLKIIFVDRRLDNIPDDHINIRNLPPECRTLLQIAVQDFSKKTVTIDTDLLTELSDPEVGFLFYHEVLLAMRGMPGSTKPIRKAVADVLDGQNFDNFEEILRKQVQ